MKNTEALAMSVGLLVVRLKYGLYVGHLSKWFVFVLMFKFWSVSRLVNGRPTIGYNGSLSKNLHYFIKSNKKLTSLASI